MADPDTQAIRDLLEAGEVEAATEQTLVALGPAIYALLGSLHRDQAVATRFPSMNMWLLRRVVSG